MIGSTPPALPSTPLIASPRARILEILKDSYGIQIKIDYTILLRQERIKLLSSNRGVHMGVQVRK